MSHRVKRPASIDPRDRQDERQIQVMATQVADQAALDKLLEGAAPLMREAMLDRLLPYLSFMPREEVTADCPICGLRRGTAIDHACAVN